MRTLAVLAALAAAAAADNLLENGGFESRDAGWSFMSFSNQAKYEFDDKTKAEGDLALRLTKEGGSKIDTAFLNFDLPPAMAGTKLQVAAQVKGKGLGQGRLVLILYNGAGDIALEKELHKRRLKKTFRWKKLEVTVEAPDDAVSGRILLQVFRKGTIWLDEVVVRGAGPRRAFTGETNLLANGGFEKERDGWAFVSFSQQARYEFDAEDKTEGGKALRVSKDGGAKIDTAFANFELQPEHAEGRFKVTAQVKAEAIGGARLVFILYNSAGDIAVNTELHGAQLAGSFDWKRLEKTFIVPDDVVSGRVLLQVLQGGVLWLDDVRVVHQTEQKDAKPTKGKKTTGLRNGDFDRSSSGWRPAASPSKSLKSDIDRKVLVTGKGALRLERTSPRLYPVEGLETSVRAKRGQKKATLVFRAKTDPGTRAIVTIIAKHRAGAMLAYRSAAVEPGQDFAAHRVGMKLPRGTERIHVFLGVEGTGQVWYDDVSLEEK